MLGRAKDVYVDTQVQQLAGLYIGTEGMIRRRVQVIQSEDVVLFGIDVILVKGTDVITNDKDFPEAGNWQRLKDLQGYEVHTPGGTKLGTVGDVILDGTGAITGLSLSRVFVKGPLAEQGTVPREVVVETSHEEKIISVDLAMLEGLAAGADEKTSAEETPEEALVEEIDPVEEIDLVEEIDPVEEIDIEVVENNDKSEAINVEDLDESDEPETKLPAADENELKVDSEEQE
jgi:uncharacterized protein YrrD